MRGVLTLAARIQPGDVVLNGDARTVERITGVQGRKPKDGAVRIRLVFSDGEALVVREDAAVRVAS